MNKIIDSFNFDILPTESQIVALAQYYRKPLNQAIFHQEVPLGEFCLVQPKRVYDYT